MIKKWWSPKLILSFGMSPFIGIANEDLPNVFDEFYRGTNVPKDIKTGSGLGLSIVKQIVENHKGKIWVTSELGVWTKFSFILPKNPSVLV